MLYSLINKKNIMSSHLMHKIDSPNLLTIIPVEELPLEPSFDDCYVFNNLARGKVTQFNHGLHKYPAKFIPQIPRWALSYRRQQTAETVLDPFCGSGTTLVENGLIGGKSIGYDISPLAVVISKAKVSCLDNLPDTTPRIAARVVGKASKYLPKILENLKPDEETQGLHYTWSFWFAPTEMAKLLSLRDAIISEFGVDCPELANFLIACLSSIVKSASYLNEDQIKVRFDKTKTPRDPFLTFPEFVVDAIEIQQKYGELAKDAGADFSVDVGSASKLDLEDMCVDRVVTSPPYINAVDYTMAHKYNLFVLGLIRPDAFKAHCRDYIGLTERAVRTKDMENLPQTGINEVDQVSLGIRNLNTQLARNRSYVVAQYFHGMHRAIHEMYRVVRPGGKIIIVVGDKNRICGIDIPTASLIETLALSSGLRTELRFYHHLANRSSMRLNRSATGGKVQLETIYVFTRP